MLIVLKNAAFANGAVIGSIWADIPALSSLIELLQWNIPAVGVIFHCSVFVFRTGLERKVSAWLNSYTIVHELDVPGLVNIVLNKEIKEKRKRIVTMAMNDFVSHV